MREDLSVSNESHLYIDHSLQKEFADIKREVKAKTGRKLQKNSIPIKEGVIVIKEDTTLDDLKRFCDACKERWGIIPLHIHIHKDEGHYRQGEWVPNLHAHIVWRMYNNEGKNCRIRDTDCTEMQTMAAEILGMERGQPSTKKHLSSLEFKIKQQEQQLRELMRELSDIRTERKEVVKQVLSLKEQADRLAKEVEEQRKKSENMPQSKWHRRLQEVSDTAKGILDRFSDLSNAKRAETAERSLKEAEKRLEEVKRGEMEYRYQVQLEAYDEIQRERRESQRRIDESGDYKARYEAMIENAEDNKPYCHYWSNLSEIAEKSKERGLNFSVKQMMTLAEGTPITMEALPSGERISDMGKTEGICIKWGVMARDFLLLSLKKVWLKYDEWRESYRREKEKLTVKSTAVQTEKEDQNWSRGRGL